MARIAAVLKATSTATWRERRSILSFGANNFVLTIIYLFHEYEMGKVFYALLAAVMLVPLSSDPLHRVPRERLDTWPLSRKERTALRFLVPWLNPITWLLAVFVVWSAALRTAASPVVVAGILAAITAVGSLLPRSSRGGLWRLVPSFPSSVGQLLRKDLRQILYTLDFWVAAVLSAIFTVARFLGADLPGEAHRLFDPDCAGTLHHVSKRICHGWLLGTHALSSSRHPRMEDHGVESAGVRRDRHSVDGSRLHPRRACRVFGRSRLRIIFQRRQ